MWSNKHDLNFSVSNRIMKNCIKRAEKMSYNPSVACETTNSNVIPREKNISHVVPVNLRLTSCDTSAKHLTKLHPFEETGQKLVSDLRTQENEIKPEEILLQDICQNKWPLSICDKKDSASSLAQLIEKENSSIAREILEKYFAICDTILSDDGQHLTDHESDVTIESSKEQDYINKIQQRFSMNEDSVPLGHKLTLILPRCNCTTSKLSRHFANSKRFDKVAKNDRTSADSMEKSGYIMIVTSDTDIDLDALLHNANDETPKKYTSHSSKKQEDEQSIFLYPDENTCQQISVNSLYHTTEVKQAQLLSKECNRATGLSAMEQLANELLVLIRQMYHTERSMLFIGLIDVISSMEQNLAEFVILAKDATHLSAPLNFLTRLTKLTDAKNIPHIYACKKKQLGQACYASTNIISAISIRIGPSYFSEEIKKIKYTIMNAASNKIKQ